jgi:hypothetical protein
LVERFSVLARSVSRQYKGPGTPRFRALEESICGCELQRKGEFSRAQNHALWCGLFLFFTAARGNAQRFNAFGGISYSDYGPNLSIAGLPPPISPKHSLIGWNGSLEVKVLTELDDQ